MIKLTPPMGWNSWNTFSENINKNEQKSEQFKKQGCTLFV